MRMSSLEAGERIWVETESGERMEGEVIDKTMMLDAADCIVKVRYVRRAPRVCAVRAPGTCRRDVGLPAGSPCGAEVRDHTTGRERDCRPYSTVYSTRLKLRRLTAITFTVRIYYMMAKPRGESLTAPLVRHKLFMSAAEPYS